MQYLLAHDLLKLAPQLIRSPQQGHVRGVFVVGEPDDPSEAVGRAHVVGDAVPLDPQDSLAPLRELVQGGAAHAADADHDYIV
ncbi:MAG: hypothetical protein IIB14_07335 [Chloroflexi bacterium]|nr:hypothetical protein [Chloroflexota bacterium]